MRVLITGMGGELGTRVANLLEADESVTEIVGIDGSRRAAASAGCRSTASSPAIGAGPCTWCARSTRTWCCTSGSTSPTPTSTPPRPASAPRRPPCRCSAPPPSCPSLQAIVVRSGIEVYGRRRGAHPARRVRRGATPPPRGARRSPTWSRWPSRPGRSPACPSPSCAAAPSWAPASRARSAATCGCPPCPWTPLIELPFCLLHQEDAAQALVAAAHVRHDGPLNVVGPGAVTASQAVLMGRRMPVPVFGPGWWAARGGRRAAGRAAAAAHPRAAGARRRGRRRRWPADRARHRAPRHRRRGHPAVPVGRRGPGGHLHTQDAAVVNFAEVTAGLPGAGTAARLGRRARGAFDVDEWGLDPELVALADPLLALRWDIQVEGAEQLPALGGAVLVFNRRFGISEPWVLARGIRQATGRFVRTVGVPDVAPGRPVPAPLRRRARPHRRDRRAPAGRAAGGPAHVPPCAAGTRRPALEVERLEAAIATGSPVVPVALLVGREVGPGLADRAGRRRPPRHRRSARRRGAGRHRPPRRAAPDRRRRAALVAPMRTRS